jgi:hypothetical protein
MTVSRTLGTLSPIVYFVNSSGGDRDPSHPAGYIMLAPFSEFPTPHGYLREYAGTLPDARRLNDRLIEQSRAEWEREAEQNHALVDQRRAEVRDRIYARMTSSATSEYEREFLRLYLQLREDKQAKYDSLWMQRTAYLHALENDLGDRDAASEEFNVERHTVRS